MSALPGLPRPLECLLKGLLEENHLSSWTSDWVDGDVSVIIRFSAKGKSKKSERAHVGTAGEKVQSVNEDSSSDSDDDDTLGEDKSQKMAVDAEEGTIGKPRKYHLLELANSPVCDREKLGSFSTPCSQSAGLVTEESGLGMRGMTTSTSSSSEEAAAEKDVGEDVSNYRSVNLRDFGNTYNSSSAENSSPEGYDEVDGMPLAAYNPRNASDTADKFDATTLVDITE